MPQFVTVAGVLAILLALLNKIVNFILCLVQFRRYIPAKVSTKTITLLPPIARMLISKEHSCVIKQEGIIRLDNPFEGNFVFPRISLPLDNPTETIGVLIDDNFIPYNDFEANLPKYIALARENNIVLLQDLKMGLSYHNRLRNFYLFADCTLQLLLPTEETDDISCWKKSALTKFPLGKIWTESEYTIERVETGFSYSKLPIVVCTPPLRKTTHFSVDGKNIELETITFPGVCAFLEWTRYMRAKESRKPGERFGFDVQVTAEYQFRSSIHTPCAAGDGEEYTSGSDRTM